MMKEAKFVKFTLKFNYPVLKKLIIDPSAKGLIFDLDGTIADSMPVHFTAYKNILREYNIDFTPEVFIPLAGVPAIETIDRLNRIYGVTMQAEVIGIRKEEEYEKIMHLIKPIEPVVSLIRKYAGIIPMSVGTGGYTRLAWKTLEILDLKKYFDILVSSEDVKNHKPHPETFLKCAEKMGVEPRFCQVFEDGQHGIKAALAAGMMVVNVTEYYEVTIGK
jgi:beta-phosphoglucomutase family hydrolase